MERPARYYLRFTRGPRLRFLSHLDMIRLWERALRRAGLPLCYSAGFHPHPRISVPLPLAVGMTSRSEWLEMELRGRVDPEALQARLAEQLPSGVDLLEVREASPGARPLATQLQGAEYEVEVFSPPPREAVEGRLRRFLDAESWPIQEQRREEMRTVDLRRAVRQIAIEGWSAAQGRLRVVVSRGNEGSSRLQQLLEVLGLPARVRIERVRLLFEVDRMRGDHERRNPDFGRR